MAKYDADTRYIYVNTENLTTTNGGDQVNNFKLNLGSNPINSDDKSLIKVSLTQFNMAKNFYNVNSTNNSLRFYLEGFTFSSMVFSTIDTIIKIPVGDYITFEIMLLNLCDQISIVMNAAANSGTSVVVAPLNNGSTTFTSNSETDGVLFSGEYGRDLVGGDQIVHPNEHKHSFNTGIYGISFSFVRTGVVFDNTDSAVRFPIIQCLHIPPSEGVVTLSTGTVLTANEQYNDSYSLFGLPRTTEFISTPTIALEDKLQVVLLSALIGGFALINPFPRNQGLDTCQYVYLRSNLATNTATNNLEASIHNHQGNCSTSHILGKIPRSVSIEGGNGRISNVYFRLDRETGYSMVITQNMINELVFSVTDSKGRVLPSDSVGVLARDFDEPSKFSTISKKINVDGNLFCDFTLKVERLSIPFAPNVLQNTPDINRNSVNPISSSVPINFNNNCGF